MVIEEYESGNFLHRFPEDEPVCYNICPSPLPSFFSLQMGHSDTWRFSVSLRPSFQLWKLKQPWARPFHWDDEEPFVRIIDPPESMFGVGASSVSVCGRCLEIFCFLYRI